MAQEMDCIAAAHSIASQVAELIKMQQFAGTAQGLVWRTPSMESLGTKIVVGVPDDYKVPKSLQGQLTRLSDTLVERLRARDGKPSKPRSKRRS